MLDIIYLLGFDTEDLERLIEYDAIADAKANEREV
jgi:hypothetical protein